MPKQRPNLVVMLKEPRPGRVKTRLGKGVGMTAAAWWFRHQSAALLRRLDDPRWNLILAVAPDHQGLTSRIWPAHLPRVPQGTGNLGDRMARQLGQHPGPTCIIGADIPGIQPSHIAQAFKALGDHDAVFGPAPDGGYWLVGLKHAPKPDLFANVRWSTKHALVDSHATMRDARIATIATLADVDTASDLARL